jgi:hypothetical protein
MAKTLGQSEEQIKDQYTLSEVFERNLFEVYDAHVSKELMSKPRG